MKYYALKDHVFYLELGVIGQDGAIVQKPTDPLARNFQAYVGGWREYTGYSATMTLSSDLSDRATYRFALLCRWFQLGSDACLGDYPYRN